MKTYLFNYFVFFMIMLATVCCQKTQTPAAAPISDNAAVAAEGSASKNSTGDTMVATVNSESINASEVEQEMMKIIAQYQGRLPAEQLQQIKPMLKKQAVESLISKKLLIQTADGKKIKPSPQDVDAELQKITGSFATEEMFQEQLSAMGITKEQLRQDIEQNLKINSVIQEKLAVVTPVTDQEINTFYTENPDKFQAPEEIRASHILLTVSADDTPEAKEQKRQQLADLRSKIEKGSDFAALAKDNSECPSKEKGGDLGFFSRGRMVKPFEDAAFSLKDGEMSPVIETQFGYHLIKVTERKAARNIPLEEVKSRLSDYLKQQKEEQAVDSFLQQLRQDAKIEYADKTAP